MAKALCALLAAAIALNTAAYAKARAPSSFAPALAAIERPSPRSVATRPIWPLIDARWVAQR